MHPEDSRIVTWRWCQTIVAWCMWAPCYISTANKQLQNWNHRITSQEIQIFEFVLNILSQPDELFMDSDWIVVLLSLWLDKTKEICAQSHWHVQRFVRLSDKKKASYHKTSNISRTLVDNKIVDDSDVVGASPVGAAPTTSSFST